MIVLPSGGRLSAETLGQRTERPLLLLRPLGGSMALWGPLAHILAQRRQVIAFDPRGVGLSSDPPWLQSTRSMAVDAVAVLNAFEVATADVFGLSLGGMVASWLAIDAPARVGRLVLGSTLPRAASFSHHLYAHLPSLVRMSLRQGVEAEVGLVQEILSPAFIAEHPARTQAILAEVRRCPTGKKNLLMLGLAALRHQAEPLLSTVTAPTLLLVGDRDPVAGRSSQAELLAHLPKAQLRRIRDCGHDLSLEQPGPTAAAIDEFLTWRDLGQAPETGLPAPS